MVFELVQNMLIVCDVECKFYWYLGNGSTYFVNIWFFKFLDNCLKILILKNCLIIDKISHNWPLSIFYKMFVYCEN